MQIELDDQLIAEIQRNLLPDEPLESFIIDACIGVLNIRDDSQLVHLVDKQARKESQTPDDIYPSIIARIKAHRAIKGWGLKDSKEWVEAHFAAMGRGGIIK